MSLDSKTIDAIHRLTHELKFSPRQIARELHVSRDSIRKYLQNPLPPKTIRVPRSSKLDSYKPVVRELMEQWPSASSVVIEQRLKSLGYKGENTIVRQYMATLRKARSSPPRAFVRIESSPGECFQIDWGYFDNLDYQGDKRKLYAFCCVECHSRRLYVEFTHSQCFETFVRCHLNAFRYMGGIPRDCLYDNLATAVSEHDGRIVMFNPRFRAFAREFGFYPKACNKAAGWEKGKVENSIGYIRKNFWPLRSFVSIYDVNFQARQWLDQTANKRIHKETRQMPDERFDPKALSSLPPLLPDYRDTAAALVHKDIRLQFDGNRYCVPPRYVGQRLTVKADSQSVVIYDKDREVARYARSWRRCQSFGAERFEKELLEQRPPAERSAAQQRLIHLLGKNGDSYIRKLAHTDRALSRQIAELHELCRQYGPDAVSSAIEKAQSCGAFGADYIKNILLQEQSPRQIQPPLQLNNERLNSIATDPLTLLDYDSLILSQRSDS